MGALGYYNSIGATVGDNRLRAIEYNNITGATEADVVGVIDDGIMGRVEDGDRMGAGDYRSIVARGSDNNVGTMPSESSVELGVCRVTIPSRISQ